ncbi:hypothetical protein GGX14DRAFT_406624 [Mycena pura]|uniref:Uncharacterized protein n=1 Tax=Mycena pura TaxID=153505 RepID=A0AAD6UPQ0_9AGAR|nr:hypothetical protein GGX14DRAFT_406624 [Mycena pura]
MLSPKLSSSQLDVLRGLWIEYSLTGKKWGKQDVPAHLLPPLSAPRDPIPVRRISTSISDKVTKFARTHRRLRAVDGSQAAGQAVGDGRRAAGGRRRRRCRRQAADKRGDVGVVMAARRSDVVASRDSFTFLRAGGDESGDIVAHQTSGSLQLDLGITGSRILATKGHCRQYVLTLRAVPPAQRAPGYFHGYLWGSQPGRVPVQTSAGIDTRAELYTQRGRRAEGGGDVHRVVVACRGQRWRAEGGGGVQRRKPAGGRDDNAGRRWAGPQPSRRVTPGPQHRRIKI